MRSLIVLSVFAVSGTAAATTVSLLGVTVDLTTARKFTHAGEDYVGWPASEAEPILELLTRRIPEADELITRQSAQLERQAQQIADLERVRENLTLQLAVANVQVERWRDAASPSPVVQVLEHPALWGIAGLVTGHLVTRKSCNGQ